MIKKRSILLLSTGRTGTKFFAKLLSGWSDEALVFHASPNSPKLNILSNMVLQGFLPEFILEKAWRHYKENEIFLNDKPLYIDSNNHLYALPWILPNLYPNLSVVHIVRDPRSYICSHINWAHQRKKSYFANFILPFWQPNAFLLGEMGAAEWLSLSQVERFAWIWHFKNNLISKLPERNIPYYRLKFEDYFEGGSEVSKRALFDFLRLDVKKAHKSTNEVENVSSKGKAPGWQYWTDAQCRGVQRICGELMSKYGYGAEPNWLERVG